ncbi:hypothetical protein COV16_03210, partial [Candidatus Woesearchaeota archaeon CG10_big_fil_rev_8_21_14_0_10_34_8]
MSTIGKRGVLGLSLSELIEAVAVIIGIVVLLGVTVKIIGILFNDPSEQFAKASYRGLVTDIKTLLQDGQQYSFDFVLYEKSDSFTLVGFDRDYSPYKLPSGWFGGSSYFPKPEQCEAYGDTACICLYKGKLKKVIECSSFNQNIDFVTLGKINGEELAGFDTKESKGIVYHEL